MSRGGASIATESSTNDDEGDNDEADELAALKAKEEEEAKRLLCKYKMDQQHLLDMRSTFLSEVLASRGIPIGPTMVDVSTPEGKKPPMETDWDCCLSTEDDPKSCLYSFDAEPNTKVISPFGTTQTISLSALNRLRRTDPTKVEPMWHSQYSILHSWFSESSPYSLLQHVDLRGYLVSTLLLDLGGGLMLRTLLVLGVFLLGVLMLPVGEYVVGRLLVSRGLWVRWASWSRFVHAALPMRLILGQMLYRTLAGGFMSLEGAVRETVVELECRILEECVPLTVGDGDGDGDGDGVGDSDGVDGVDSDDGYDDSSDWD